MAPIRQAGAGENRAFERWGTEGTGGVSSNEFPQVPNIFIPGIVPLGLLHLTPDLAGGIDD
jgi:hypothetical protein